MKRETVSPQSAVGQFFVVFGSSGYGAGVARRGEVGCQRGSAATEATEETEEKHQQSMRSREAWKAWEARGVGRALSRPLRPGG